eukprot:scaffold854_cov343-Prasinococcus_capsulatus_cf.AAC.6
MRRGRGRSRAEAGARSRVARPVCSLALLLFGARPRARRASYPASEKGERSRSSQTRTRGRARAAQPHHVSDAKLPEAAGRSSGGAPSVVAGVAGGAARGNTRHVAQPGAAQSRHVSVRSCRKLPVQQPPPPPLPPLTPPPLLPPLPRGGCCWRRRRTTSSAAYSPTPAAATTAASVNSR